MGECYGTIIRTLRRARLLRIEAGLIHGLNFDHRCQAVFQKDAIAARSPE